jgi:CHAD domain-containing protein
MGLQPVYRETVIPALSQLQECLGTLQDCHVQVTRLTQALASLKAMRPDIHQKVRAGVMTLVRESRQVATREMRTYRTRIKEWNQLASSSPLADLILVADPHQTLAG